MNFSMGMQSEMVFTPQMPGTIAIPPELNARSRRIRSRGGIGERLVYIFVGLFILPHTLVGIGFLFAMLGGFFWALAGENRVADVERLWTTAHSKGQTYHVAYGYSIPELDRRRHSEATVPRAVYEKLSSAAPDRRTVTVRSLGFGPRIFYDNITQGTADAWRKVGLLWLGGTFWAGCVSIFAYMIYIRPWLVRRLYRRGVAVPGSIVNKRTTRDAKTGAVSHRITFRYTTLEGETHEREMVAHRNAGGGNARLHEPVTVLYDAGHPKRSIAYEYGPLLCLET
jgi:hypothetical protein